MQTLKTILLKSLSQFITKTLKENNIKIKQSKLLEIISHYYQYNDWNNFVAIEKMKNIKEFDVRFFGFYERDNFKSFLLCFDEENRDMYEVMVKKENLTEEIIEIFEEHKRAPTIDMRKITIDLDSFSISLNKKDFLIDEANKNIPYFKNDELLKIGKYIANELNVSVELILSGIMSFIVKEHYKNKKTEKIISSAYYDLPLGKKEDCFKLDHKDQKFVSFLLKSHVCLLNSLDINKIDEESDIINIEKINKCYLWIEKLDGQDETTNAYEINFDHLICLLENIQEELEDYDMIYQYIQKIIEYIEKDI